MSVGNKKDSVLWAKMNSADEAERKQALATILAEWLSEAELSRLARMALARHRAENVDGG
jgi:DNA-binding TFAR19-related protein (PDSD5 family)